MNQADMRDRDEIIIHLKAENERLKFIAAGYQEKYRQAKAELEALKKEEGR